MLLAAAATLFAACGSDSSKSSGTSSPAGDGTAAQTTAAQSTETTEAGAPSTVEQGVVGSESSVEPVKGGTLRMAVYGETAGLDPVKSVGSGTSGGTELGTIYDTLMRYDPETNSYVPQMAESLTPNSDFTVWTLKLRDGVTFTDGTSLDAAAVQFSLQRHIDLKSRHAGLVASIASYASPDPLTLEMTLKSSWSGFPYVLAYMPGMIVSPTAVQAKGDEEFNKSPVGAGPFMLERYAPGEEIVVKANPGYWGGAPYLDSIRFAPIVGAQPMLDGLNAGDIQAAFLREAPVVKAARDAGYEGLLMVQNAGGVLLLNQGRNDQKTIAQDLRVRQAISYALDRDLIDERGDNGTGYPTASLFGKQSIWHTTDATINYDPEKAKALVEEVKQETGWDGSIRFNCTNSPSRVNFAVAVQALLDAVGFKTQLDTSSTVGELTRLVSIDGNFDIACYGLNVGDEAPYIALNQHLSSQSVQNASAFKSADFDALLNELRGAKDDAASKEILGRLQGVWDAEMPAVIYAAIPEFLVWGKNVHGVKPTVKTMGMFDKAFIAS